MPARCEHCGEEALTDTARFCVGCGAPLPELDPHEVLAELDQAAPREPPPVLHLPETAPPEAQPAVAPRPQPPAPQVDTPSFAARPSPPRLTAPRPAQLPPMRDLSPVVPLSLVVAGLIGLLALLLILLLAA